MKVLDLYLSWNKFKTYSNLGLKREQTAKMSNLGLKRKLTAEMLKKIEINIAN